MTKRQFTAEELVKSQLADLTHDEISEHFRTNRNRKKYPVHSDGFFARLWRRIRPGKLFYIKFASGYGLILKAKDEADACITAVPFLQEGSHHCRNPYFNKSCSECRAVFDELAERLNNAKVTWIGWAQPDNNWVIHT